MNFDVFSILRRRRETQKKARKTKNTKKKRRTLSKEKTEYEKIFNENEKSKEILS